MPGTACRGGPRHGGEFHAIDEVRAAHAAHVGDGEHVVAIVRRRSGVAGVEPLARGLRIEDAEHVVIAVVAALGFGSRGGFGYSEARIQPIDFAFRRMFTRLPFFAPKRKQSASPGFSRMPFTAKGIVGPAGTGVAGSAWKGKDAFLRRELGFRLAGRAGDKECGGCSQAGARWTLLFSTRCLSGFSCSESVGIPRHKTTAHR